MFGWCMWCDLTGWLDAVSSVRGMRFGLLGAGWDSVDVYQHREAIHRNTDIPYTGYMGIMWGRSVKLAVGRDLHAAKHYTRNPGYGYKRIIS